MTDHRHVDRLHALQGVGAVIPYELLARVRTDYYEPRAPEQVASDEATIAALELQAAPAFAERELRARAARIEHLDLPITVADADLLARDKPDETRALKATRAWYEGDVPLLVLSGPPGRGKTLAACCALVSVGGRYVRAPYLARLFAAQWGDEVTERERLVATDGLVVADDVGAERNAEAMAVGLLEVLDARRRGQRTIWITNLARGDFEARYPDPRLLSRMAQSARWLVDAGADMRRGRA